MLKKLISILTILALLATLLCACGRRERSFQGTVTDVTDQIVTVTPDPGAEILDRADSVWFDATELEDLQVKTGDSIYITYDKVYEDKKEGTSLRVIAWQMMIRSPNNDPEAAVIWQSGSEVTVTGEEAALLIQAVNGVDWQSGILELEPTYGLRTGGTDYGLDLTVQNCVWIATLTGDTGNAKIVGGDAVRMALVYQANGIAVTGLESVDPASGTKTTTTGLNLRDKPGTDSTVMTTVPKGTDLTVTGLTNGWYQVLYQDMTLYASGDYLQ